MRIVVCTRSAWMSLESHNTLRQLGNYELGALIGRGGMGEVWEGSHRFLGTPVAVKTLRGAIAENPSLAQRFFFEARASVQIQHPNIVRVLDFGQAEDGALYLVMERLVGRSLGALLDRGPLSVAHTAEIGTLVCRGLAAAHALGIVHRDLKPDNVFLTATEVKILDFGIAKVVSQVGSTSQSAVMGTPLYMAPEQAKASASLSARTDIYALGVILFEMLTGRTPFVGESASHLIVSHMFETPPRPSTFLPMHEALERLILECLAKAPEARPASMDEVADRLAQFRGDPPSLPAVGPLDVTELEGALTAAEPSSARVSRSRRMSTLSSAIGQRPATSAGPSLRSSVVAAAVGFCVVVAAAAAVLRPSSAPEPMTPVVVAPIASPVVAAKAAEPAQPPTLVLRSDPSGAIVRSGERVLGETPLVVHEPLPIEITLTRRGYARLHEVVSTPGDHVLHLARTNAPAPKQEAPHAPSPAGEGLD